MTFTWIVYRKGSFPVKESYSCPKRAERRRDTLLDEFCYANLVTPDSSPQLQKLLAACIEIPPPSA